MPPRVARTILHAAARLVLHVRATSWAKGVASVVVPDGDLRHCRSSTCRGCRQRICCCRFGGEKSGLTRPPRRLGKSPHTSLPCKASLARRLVPSSPLARPFAKSTRSRQTIASAVDERGSATREITRNVQQASVGRAWCRAALQE